MSKTIYLARHGEAIALGEEGIQTDFERHLSLQGREKLKAQAQGFQTMGISLDICYTSPLVRAVQTAEILTQAVTCEIEKQACLGEQPAFSAVQTLLARSPAQKILLVTHQPFIVRLTGFLLSGEPLAIFQYGTGSMACFQIDNLDSQPQGELIWLLTSEQMAKMA